MSEMWRKCGVEKAFYGCSNYPNCTFTLSDQFRRKIDENQSEGIVSRERNRGFRNQKGRQDDL